MSLDKVQARDARARQALVDYTRGQCSENACRDTLRTCGWSQASIEKIIAAAKAGIIKVDNAKS